MSYKADNPPYKRAVDDYAAAVNAFPKPSNDVPIAMIQARFFNATGSAFSEFVRNLAGYTELLEPPALLELVRLQITGVRRDLQARAELFRHQQTADSSCLVYLRRLRELLNETGYDKTLSRDDLLRDLFVHGLQSQEARRVLFQRDATTLSIDECVVVASSSI